MYPYLFFRHRIYVTIIRLCVSCCAGNRSPSPLDKTTIRTWRGGAAGGGGRKKKLHHVGDGGDGVSGSDVLASSAPGRWRVPPFTRVPGDPRLPISSGARCRGAASHALVPWCCSSVSYPASGTSTPERLPSFGRLGVVGNPFYSSSLLGRGKRLIVAQSHGRTKLIK